jgi:scyllo-inositol 2-dehydrogenase (NAD+)
VSAARVGIGIAVVGTGVMGRRHAENAARSVPGARLAALFDADRAVANRVASELEADACGSLEQLLARDDVDVVAIASPSRFHAEHAVAALEAGKDVLLEKPMAHSLADCDRIIGAAARAKRRLQIGFMRRYDPAYAEAKRLIASGALGEPRLFRAVHRDREASYLPAEAGVRDLMFESTIHDFDLARFLLDDDIAAVTTTAAALCHERGAHGHAPSAALNAVTFRRGGVADIETYWGAVYAYDVRTEVVCASGTAMIGHQQRTRLDVYTAAGAAHDLFPGFLERFGDAYREELIDFVRGARERREPRVTGADGRAAVAAAIAGVAAYASGRAEPVAA